MTKTKWEKTAIDSETMVTREVIESVLSLSTQRINELVTADVLVRTAHNTFPLVACTNGYIHFLKQGATKKEDTNRWAKARAELTELKIAEKTGEVVKLSWVEQHWGDMVMRFRQKILALPTKAAPLLANEGNAQRIAQVLEGFCNEALAELVETDTRSSSKVAERGESNPEPVEATA